jgi:uncharacterized protein (DUF885 family)
LSDVDALAEEYFAYLMEDDPTWAHMLGDYSRADRFQQIGRAAEDERIARLRSFAERAEAVDPTSLDDDARITRGVLVTDTTTRADLTAARLAEISADPIFGLQTMMPVMAGVLGVPDAEVAEKMLSMVGEVGRHFRELGDRLREGLAAGRAPAAFAVEGTIAQIEAAVLVPAAEDPLLSAITLPGAVDGDAWRARLAKVIESELRPGILAYRDVLRDEVAGAARSDDQAGLCHIPDGTSAYEACLRFYTTTAKTAQEIHDLGLSQVASLAEEYRALGATALGTSDLEEIFERMRSDPELHFKSPDQLVHASEVALQRAWDAMGDWFEVLPQAPCVVEGVNTGAKAYYFPPANDGSRGGTFFVNVSDPGAWGTFELEAMAFHEGIPGHHLQLAVAGELPDSVPAIRKYADNAAYAEGWGLYTERLADEMGLYSSDVDRLGMLSADSMRACRLVVDTGLHALGWSRQQAVDYMLDNSPLRPGVVRPEIDRYLVNPGQATSYMVGRLEIQRMRREAEARPGFDIRKFHSAVLDSGMLPLDVLDEVVRARV